jgi:hypothetical protein
MITNPSTTRPSLINTIATRIYITSIKRTDGKALPHNFRLEAVSKSDNNRLKIQTGTEGKWLFAISNPSKTPYFIKIGCDPSIPISDSFTLEMEFYESNTPDADVI